MTFLFGDPAPTFVAAGASNPRYVFDTAAGRYLLLAIVPAGPAAAKVRDANLKYLDPALAP